MQVEVRDFLPCVEALVGDEPVALDTCGGRDLRGDGEAVRGCSALRIGGGSERIHVLIGDDEQVCGRFGADVPDGECGGVLKNHF
jgi:hypothetical protein